MAYIPESHKKYNLLSNCDGKNTEVIICDEESDLFHGIWELLPDDEKFMPYADNVDDVADCFFSPYSYSEYYTLLDNLINKYGDINGETRNLGDMITEFKDFIEKANIKENWSICRYIGESTDDDTIFINGRYYYWACTKEPLRFYGIIDEDGFTVSVGDKRYDYRKPAYPIDGKLWEIVEDPTGIAERLLW